MNITPRLRSAARRSSSVVAAAALMIGGVTAVAGASVKGAPVPEEQAGTLYSFGGGATARDRAVADHAVGNGIPASVGDQPVVGVWAAPEWALALTAAGEYVTWGTSNSQAIRDSFPDGLGRARSVSLKGTSNALAVAEDGRLVAWGNDLNSIVSNAPDVDDAVKVSFGERLALVLRDNGTVEGWGNPVSGDPLSVAEETNVVDIVATNTYAAVLKSDGTVVVGGTAGNAIPAEDQGRVEAIWSSGGTTLAYLTEDGVLHNTGPGFVFQYPPDEMLIDVNEGLRLTAAGGLYEGYFKDFDDGEVVPEDIRARQVSGSAISAVGGGGVRFAIVTDELRADDSPSVVTDSVLNGTPVQNETLTVTPAEFSGEPEGEVVTRFFRQATTEGAEPVEITGPSVSGLTLRVPNLAIGQLVFATQTATVDGDELVATSNSVGPVEGFIFAAGGPVISGEPQVGAVLSVDTPGSFLPAGADVTLTTQWFADGVLIEGATGDTFTVTGDQVGQSITAKQTGTTPSGLQAKQTPASNAVGPIEPPPLAEVTPPSIAGTPQVGQTLTGTPATFNDTTDAVTVTNQWLADGEVIEGATDVTLDLAEEQLDADITFRSTAAREGSDPVVSESEPVGPVLRADIPIAVDADPIIEGTAKVGETLTGTPATFTGDTEGEPTNQWLANGEAIDGETGLTLDLTAEQAGQVITFRSTQAGIGGPLSATSAPTAAVQALLEVDDVPTIVGDAEVGQTLTGTPGTFTGSPDAVTNQWLADGEAIDGEAGTTLVLTEELEGAVITFASTATRDGDDPVTSTSEPTDAVAPMTDEGGGNGDGDGDGDGDGGPTPGTPAEDLEGVIDVLNSNPVQPGDILTVRVGTDYAGQQVTVWLFSDPRQLGTFEVAANGQIQGALPRDVAPGEHMLAVYDSDGQLIGFDTIVVAGAGGTGGAGGLGGAVGGVLPDTGSPASVSLWMLGIMMTLAGGVLLAPATVPRVVSRLRRMGLRMQGYRPRHLAT